MSLDGISNTDGTGLVYASIRCRISSAICTARRVRRGRDQPQLKKRKGFPAQAPAYVLRDENDGHIAPRGKVLERLLNLRDGCPCDRPSHEKYTAVVRKDPRLFGVSAAVRCHALLSTVRKLALRDESTLPTPARSIPVTVSCRGRPLVLPARRPN